jgi:hypothetical protein
MDSLQGQMVKLKQLKKITNNSTLIWILPMLKVDYVLKWQVKTIVC